ncbi:MAG: transcription antitermination factor NusB [Verrucomicrobia bacterium]|nr:transcription antitermination factor NusB [Verrucomicrobiota bacterium]
MTISPQKLREIVFLLLYSCDFGGSTDEEMVPLLMKELCVSKKVMRQAIETKDAVQLKRGEIDAIITQYSKSYDFERIPRIERNILRLGIFELLHSEHIPAKVAIAEAIRLTRKFATPEAATFVNAIIDALYQEQEGKELSLVSAGESEIT